MRQTNVFGFSNRNQEETLFYNTRIVSLFFPCHVSPFLSPNAPNAIQPTSRPPIPSSSHHHNPLPSSSPRLLPSLPQIKWVRTSRLPLLFSTPPHPQNPTPKTKTEANQKSWSGRGLNPGPFTSSHDGMIESIGMQSERSTTELQPRFDGGGRGGG